MMCEYRRGGTRVGREERIHSCPFPKRERGRARANHGCPLPVDTRTHSGKVLENTRHRTLVVHDQHRALEALTCNITMRIDNWRLAGTCSSYKKFAGQGRFSRRGFGRLHHVSVLSTRITNVAQLMMNAYHTRTRTQYVSTWADERSLRGARNT